MTLGWKDARAITVAELGGAAIGGSAAASVAANLWLR